MTTRPLTHHDLRLAAIATAFYADHLREHGGPGAADDYDDASDRLDLLADYAADHLADHGQAPLVRVVFR